MKALTVDWWHTIAEPDGDDWMEFSKRVRIEKILEVLDIQEVACDPKALDAAYDSMTEEIRVAWKQGLDWPAFQQVSTLLARANVTGVTDYLIRELFDPMGWPLLARPPVLREGALETLEALKESGLRLAIISNTGRTWGRYLRTVQTGLGLDGVFEERTFSDEVEARKPSEKIFAHTLRVLDLPASEVAHIGDDVRTDVAGAKAVGMRAVWYDTGFWTDADGGQADAVVHAWSEVPDAIRSWR